MLLAGWLGQCQQGGVQLEVLSEIFPDLVSLPRTSRSAIQFNSILRLLFYGELYVRNVSFYWWDQKNLVELEKWQEMSTVEESVTH